jgi:hypothetical protein
MSAVETLLGGALGSCIEENIHHEKLRFGWFFTGKLTKSGHRIDRFRIQDQIWEEYQILLGCSKQENMI